MIVNLSPKSLFPACLTASQFKDTDKSTHYLNITAFCGNTAKETLLFDQLSSSGQPDENC